MHFHLNKIDWKSYQTDKASRHSYVPLYERLLSGIGADDILIEIGVKRGGSLLAFRDMLGCKVVGLDVSPMPETLKGEAGISCLQADAYCKETLELLSEYEGKCAAVIEDGSHEMTDMCYVATHYGRMLKPGGVLVIEDICRPFERAQAVATCLPPDMRDGSFIADLRLCKHKRDDIAVVGFRS